MAKRIQKSTRKATKTTARGRMKMKDFYEPFH